MVAEKKVQKTLVKYNLFGLKHKVNAGENLEKIDDSGRKSDGNSAKTFEDLKYLMSIS